MAAIVVNGPNIVPNKNSSLGIAYPVDIRDRPKDSKANLQTEALLEYAIESRDLGKKFWDIAPKLIEIYHEYETPYPCHLSKKRAAIELVSRFSEDFPENSQSTLARLDQIWKASYMPVSIGDQGSLKAHIEPFSHSLKHPHPKPLVDLANIAREKKQSFWEAVPCLIQKWHDMEQANPDFERVPVNIGVHLIAGFAHKTSASAITVFIAEVWKKIYAKKP